MVFGKLMIDIYISTIAFNKESIRLVSNDLDMLFSAEEISDLEGFKVPKRQDEWIVSRLLAKKFIKIVLHDDQTSTADIRIKKEPSGQPYIWINGRGRIPGAYSLSHSNGQVFCGYTPDSGINFGLDLEKIENRKQEFIQDFFTQREMENSFNKSGSIIDEYVTLIWSAKEAFLKAIGKGLSLDTRKVEIAKIDGEFDKSGWDKCRVDCFEEPGFSYRILSQRYHQFIRTICVPENQLVNLIEVKLDLFS
jgi:phosphopantetheine--protein transferase-like protein